MSFPYRALASRGPSRQRGAIGLMAALTLGLALLSMVVVVDSGRLYMEKRALQRVADTAALEAMNRSGTCIAPALTAANFATQSAARNAFIVNGAGRTLVTTCGTMVTGSNKLRTFSLDASKAEAIRVVASKTVPTSIAAGIAALFSANSSLNTTLSATAVASYKPLPPLAQLTIRNTMVSVDASKSAVLNQLFGQLLGGSLNLSIAGWQGLIDTNINLLSYMNQLAIDLNVAAGNYTGVLATNVSITRLIDTAITVLTAGGTTTSLAVSGLTDLKAAAGNTQIKLGDILKLQTATPSSGLDAGLNVFQLVEAVVQLANTQNFANATIPLSIPGLVNGSVQLKVVSPPQLSAIGNPANINVTPIEVRTAQLRVALSLNLPVLSTGPVNSALNGLVAPLTDVLNNLLSLNLGATVSSLVCAVLGGYCQTTDLQVLSSSSTPPASKIDVVLGISSVSSKVTGYTCASDGSKTLSTESNTSLTTVQAGDISPSALASSGSVADADVKPLALVDIGAVTCFRPLLGLGPINCNVAPRKPFYGGGLGLKISTNATAQTPYTYVYNQPPEIKQPALYNQVPTQGILNALNQALTSIQLQVYKPTGANLLGGLLATSGTLLNNVNSSLGGLLGGVLSSLVDPVINTLLNNLGLNLNKVEVGANLSCKPPGRAELVL